MKWIKKRANDELEFEDDEITILAVSTEWCGPCKSMKKTLAEKLPDEAASRFGKEQAEKIKLIVLDGDDDKNNGEFFEKFGVSCYPTWFIFHVEDDELKMGFRQEGWGDELFPELMELLGGMISKGGAA